MTTRIVLYEATGVAAAAMDTGIINLQQHGNIDAILVEIDPSAAMTTAAIKLIDPDCDATNQIATVNTGTGTVPVCVAWGLGVQGTSAMTQYLGGIPAPLPHRVKVTVATLGTGVTNHLRVIGVSFGR